MRRSLATALLLAATDPALAGGSPDLAAGRELASVHCSRCHAIGREGTSPMASAPPFRDLDQRYSLEALAEALAEGIVTGHPQMPSFTFTPDQIESFLAYLESLG